MKKLTVRTELLVSTMQNHVIQVLLLKLSKSAFKCTINYLIPELIK